MKKLISLFFLVTLAIPVFSGQADNQAVPAYMTEAQAKKKMPATLPPEGFSDPQVVRAYTVAKRIPRVLAQQPCYCWCSRGGHRGLLDCYVGDHASHCGVCLKEALYADKLTKEGKTPAEIRASIEKSGWVNVE